MVPGRVYRDTGGRGQVIYFLLVLSVLLNVALGITVRRFAVRCLQFDRILEGVPEVLEPYGQELLDMTKDGLLTDNDEVLTFHRRNQRAIKEIAALVDDVREGRR